MSSRRIWIARISPQTGAVTGWIDLRGLLPEADWRIPVDVLNGIAYDAGGKRLFVTGKLWPKLFEIELFRREPVGMEDRCDRESGWRLSAGRIPGPSADGGYCLSASRIWRPVSGPSRAFSMASERAPLIWLSNFSSEKMTWSRVELLSEVTR